MSMSYRHVIERELDGNGNPISGAQLYFYDAGTTTPRDVYSDSALTIPLAQPVLSDSYGRFPVIFIKTGTYKCTVLDADGVVVRTMDGVDPGLSSAAGALTVTQGGTGASTAAQARTNLDVPSNAEFDAMDIRVADVEAILSAPILAAAQSVTYGSTVSPDFSATESLTITLTGNITFAAPNVIDGQKVRLILIQDATGNRSVTFSSHYKFSGGSPPAFSTTANSVDVLTGYARGSYVDFTGAVIQDYARSASPDVIIKDIKASGTAGGTSVAGSWETRVLNTIERNRGAICGLSANGFSLSKPGMYRIKWDCPALASGAHRSKLYNVTTSSDVSLGSSAYSASSGIYGATVSSGDFDVSITGDTTFEIRHRVTTALATNGFGFPSSMGSEVYTVVEIWKL